MSTEQHVIDVRILGPLEAVDADGRPIELGQPKQRAVLALLALEVGRVVSADRMTEELWRDAAPPGAANSVQAYVSRLRKALGSDAITTRARGYALAIDPSAVDATRFERLAAEGRDLLDEDDPRAASEVLRRALALWRGPALAGLEAIPSCDRERRSLDDVRIQVLEERVEADLACGRHPEVATELRGLIEEHPLRERFTAMRMLALYRCERQAEALDDYERLRSILADELGMDPSPDVKRLHEAILRHDADLDWRPRDGQTAKTAPAPPPSNIPEPATSFVGRTIELEELRRILGSARLVTLTGSGGAGKTRLAVELARTSEHAWLVSLAGSGPGQATEQVMRELKLRDVGDRPPHDVIVAALTHHEGLLVLDNCEHMVEECAYLVSAIIAGAPRIRVIATSREPLRTGGETTYRVRPLRLPDPSDPEPLDAAAARLFVDRASAVSPSFDPTPHADAISDIVRRVDGIPLAIELAAARTDILAPKEIADRLQDALGLLTGGPRTDEPHHQALRATLRWSYETLTESQRLLFARLSLFMGGFTLAQAEAVCGDGILDDLARLVALSLVESSDAGDVKRFSMLETTRQYGAELLRADGGSERSHRRHLAYFVTFVADAQMRLAGPDQAAAIASLETELPNIRAAMQFAFGAGGDAASGIRIATAMVSFWQMRGYLAEGRRFLEMALGVCEDERATIGMHLGLGAICQMLGDLDAAQRHQTDALEVAHATGQEGPAARALNNLGNVAIARGDLERGRQLLTEAVDTARSAGDVDLLTRALNNLAQIVRRLGDVAHGRKLYDEALEHARALGDPVLEVTILLNVGEIDRMAGDLSAARELLDLALEGARRIGYQAAVAAALGALGNLDQDQGDLAGAHDYFSESVEVARKMGSLGLVAAGIGNLASVQQELGHLDAARDAFGEYRSISEDLGDRRGAARARRGLAGVARAKGNHRRAASLLSAALNSAQELGQPDEIAECLDEAASLAVAYGQPQRADLWNAAATALRRGAGLLVRDGAEDDVADPDAEVASAATWLSDPDAARAPVP